MSTTFFTQQTVSSKIKASIVAKYFPSYCKIINRSPQKQIRYLDLFAGPGIYEDGNWSTPLLIADQISKDEILKNKVRLIFNDNQYCNELKENFNKNFPQGTFHFPSQFGNVTIGDNEKMRRYLIKDHAGENNQNPFPTLLFFDPWGYKGIDTKVLGEFMKNWGNEIFLFVNIKRIHAAIKNSKFDQLMYSLFPTSFETIKSKRRYTASVHERLDLIMEYLAKEFESIVPDKLFHTAFKFQEEDSKATSHYIIHFTKHPKGYELVKQVFYDFDNIGANLEKDGTYTFDAKKMHYNDPLGLYFGDDNLQALSDKLFEEYNGRTISAEKLFQKHQQNNKYCASHYAKTLRKMVDDGLVISRFTDNVNHKVSVLLTKHCILTFNKWQNRQSNGQN